MGKVTGFLEFERNDRDYAPVEERIRHWREFVLPLPEPETRKQAARCMNCGIPYCHTGCPVNNQIPDWNDLVYTGAWQEASRNLHSTNNFPEFTGRVCPAPCEASCTLNIDDNPVTIKTIECAIVDRAFEQGWLKPEPPAVKTGKSVAIVGSGPAGLACAQQLARVGHNVHVYEKHAKPGGLLRYGIPDFKMEKHHVERRVAQMEAEGVRFRCGVHVGVTHAAAELVAQHDAVVLTGGSEHARDLPIPGRDLKGIHFAMDFLPQQNRVVAGDPVEGQISAAGKRVVVIGGGDTGSDCVGTSNRQGATKVTQFELLPQPPEVEDKAMTWPYWPVKLRTSSSHEEGCERDWSVATKSFKDDGHGRVQALIAVRVEMRKDAGGQVKFVEVAGSEFDIPAQLVLLAMGFVSPVASVVRSFGVETDARGNARASLDDGPREQRAYATSVPKVFAAGDMRRGQSLVVWAIREGRQCARAVDQYLMGRSELPR
jgi:glutamate synthase (NADPH/NADH) small chain